MKNTEKIAENKFKNSDLEKEKFVPDESKAKTDSEKKAEFEKLIEGEYKDVFEEIVREKTSSSLKENIALKDKIKQTEEILEMLSDRYSSGSAYELKKAIKADNSLFEEKAGKYGMDVDSYRYMRNLERENARARAMMERAGREAEMAKKIRAWQLDSDNVAKQYPGFNLAEEISNPMFIQLIKNGVDIRTAYEVIHHQEIMNKLSKENAAEAKKTAVMELEARNNRPVENGLSSQSSALLKKDLSLLTPEERAEIARRAAKGEVITF